MTTLMSSMTRVVDPLFVDVMEFVVDRYRGPVIADDLGVHLRIVPDPPSRACREYFDWH